MVNGRPRKTQDELDKEMDDYWNKQGEANGTQNRNGDVTAPEASTAAVIDEDIDMIE